MWRFINEKLNFENKTEKIKNRSDGNKALQKTLQIEEEQLKNAFCAGWDKSKTALIPNKKNHYSIEYLNKIKNEGNSNI